MAVLDLFRRFMHPAVRPDADRRHEPRAHSRAGVQVLVVDDSATIRAVLRKMLLQDGYTVLQAADAEQGVKLALEERPGLIFLDVVMPGMSGFSALRALRRETATHATPIVMMSGNQQATEQFYVRRIGADGFIKKPFGRADVFHAIRVLIESGQMPARVEPPADPIPAGMSQAEWNAIPEVGLPDPAPAPAALPAVGPSATPTPAAVDPAPPLPEQAPRLATDASAVATAGVEPRADAAER